MWEESLIFVLIYLGVFFILPDKVRKKILTNGVLCAMIIIGFFAGLYGIFRYLNAAEGFYQSDVCGDPAIKCEPVTCEFTASISETGALSNINVTSGNLTEGMSISIKSTDSTSTSATLLPINTVISTYISGSTTGQLSGPDRFTGINGTFTGSSQTFCQINIKTLPSSDFDQTISFNMYGRYVRIYAPKTAGNGLFSLSQVVVNNAAGTNIALGKTATAVSTATSTENPQPTPSTALDGNLTPRPKSKIWGNRNVARETEYWQVDLESVQMITSVRIITDKSTSAPTITPNPQTTTYIENTGLRVVVMKLATEVPSPKGICATAPIPVFPAGAITAEEKSIIGPMILDGLNGATALSIYRVIASSSLPSTFTPYGFTDSQSASAVLKIVNDNLITKRNNGTLSVSDFYAQAASLKGLTTMAGITTANINVPNEISEYMLNNKKETKSISSTPVFNPTTQAMTSGITTISDGGKEQLIKTIMSVLKSTAVDPSSGYSQATAPDANAAIGVTPNTGEWGKSLLQNAPTKPALTPLPSTSQSGETTFSANMTPSEKMAAAMQNNPNILIITPDMSDQEKNTMIQQKASTQNVMKDGTSRLTEAEIANAGNSTSDGKGYVKPVLSKAEGGQGQWYMRTVYGGRPSAEDRCKDYNGRLATLQQIQDAQAKGGSCNAQGWYADSSTEVAWANPTRVQVGVSSPGNYFTHCYGPKPPPGTADIAPWTDTAKQFKNPPGPTYVAGDWSQRIGGDGGAETSTDTNSPNKDVTIKNPGTPLKTQEVYYVGGSEDLTQTQATSLCTKLGGTLATNEQLDVAKTAGANWCGRGWLSDSSRKTAGSNCSTSKDGANCFGMKPSMNSSGRKVGTVDPSDSPVTFTLEVVPFKTTSSASSWNQIGQDEAGNCRPGQVSTQCTINGSTQQVCLNPGEKCSQACPGGGSATVINGRASCSGSSEPLNCPAGSTSVNCGPSPPNYACLTPSDTCASVPQNGGADPPKEIAYPEDASKEPFKEIVRIWNDARKKRYLCAHGNDGINGCIGNGKCGTDWFQTGNSTYNYQTRSWEVSSYTPKDELYVFSSTPAGETIIPVMLAVGYLPMVLTRRTLAGFVASFRHPMYGTTYQEAARQIEEIIGANWWAGWGTKLRTNDYIYSQITKYTTKTRYMGSWFTTSPNGECDLIGTSGLSKTAYFADMNGPQWYSIGRYFGDSTIQNECKYVCPYGEPLEYTRVYRYKKTVCGELEYDTEYNKNPGYILNCGLDKTTSSIK